MMSTFKLISTQALIMYLVNYLVFPLYHPNQFEPARTCHV